MLKKPVNIKALLFLIILVGFLLRIIFIDHMPPSLNWDEVSHGYNAYSILKSGMDEWGVRFPAIFRAYGDYKLPVYIYLTSVSEFFLGLTPLAVRLPSVLAGVATILFAYLLGKKLFGEKIGLLSAFFVAVEPWSFFLSRGAFEANLALFFVVSGFYLFLKGLKDAKYLILSILLLGFSVWTYNSARIFVPLMLLTATIINWKEMKILYKKTRAHLLGAGILALVLFAPMFYQLLNPQGQARYSKVAIIDAGAIAQINEKRAASNLPQFLERVIYNKGTYFADRFARNWLSHFSLDFLAVNGGSHYQFSLPKHGLIYSVNVIFFLVGLIFLVKKRTRESAFILSWLILSPIASSLTREAPHALRAITMLPIPMIIVSLGVVNGFSWLKRKSSLAFMAGLIVYILALFIVGENYFKRYLFDYSSEYSWSWQYGYREATDSVKGRYEDFDKIIVTKEYGEPHEFFLFYLGWDPEKYRQDPNLIRFEQSGWFWVDGFDKFYFVNDWDIPKSGNTFVLESKGKADCTKGACLLVTSPGNHPSGWKILETIYFLNGQPAFEIYEN